MLRIANCSGFYGDRFSAAREMVEGGPIDVLTGDWLAELTMLILAGNRLKGRPGYAPTFLGQLEEVLGTCLDRGIRIVSNAGGLDPAGCAGAVAELADRLGLPARVAHVTGDDVSGHDLRGARNLDTGERLSCAPLTANAYLGGRPIAAALSAGADVVVTGRVTDAALVTGPGIWRYGWRPGDHDALAGSVVAGHVIECGCQATGGNYAFFGEVPGLARCGFPIAELHADGSSVITKHPGTGGMVSVGTVTAQLLYEIGSPRYLGPDAVARFDTIRLEQLGPDRVRISGVRGEAPPDTLKVAITYLGGYRNSMTMVLTGLELEAKARLAQEAIWSRVPRDSFERVHVELIPLSGTVSPADAPSTGARSHGVPGDVPEGDSTPHGTDSLTEVLPTEATSCGTALLRVTVMDSDRRRAGRLFSSAVVETGLASYPGCYGLTPPGDASPYGVLWPALIPADAVQARVRLDGREVEFPGPDAAEPGGHGSPPAPDALPTPPMPHEAPGAPNGRERAAGDDERPVRRVPLGTIMGARSGDKGGNANLGVWTRTPEQYAWLSTYLTAERLGELLPATARLRVDRFELPNLNALNFVVRGLLGRGVAASPRLDAQAKALGEELRARYADIPPYLL
ncbi:acyclic terpene utilization AtuA family protein [Streptosporangium sp. NPDC051023]|uniref:acyclic terpene utilization AtuA family protein n=1 Tax=Streptosporangium sp. NPDC051023 TaxID=3155410 RepID=UPI00344ED751